MGRAVIVEPSMATHRLREAADPMASSFRTVVHAEETGNEAISTPVKEKGIRVPSDSTQVSPLRLEV